MNTLRGVFPEPPILPKRNFIKENMLQIKRMQGVINDDGDNNMIRRKNVSIDQYDSSQRTMKLIRNTKKQLQGLSIMSQIEKNKEKENPIHERKHSEKRRYNYTPDMVTPVTRSRKQNREGQCKTAVETLNYMEKRKFKEIGIQTELHMGAIPAKCSTAIENARSLSPKQIGDGDKMKRRGEQTPEKQEVNKYNAKSSNTQDPLMPPPSYQKGVVPKYLRERKEGMLRTQNTGNEERCPEGHVVLPENERKETLRMLRQSYSELVSELNQLPVRSDTLKIRNRKMEIENQLKKLDEGIKVFTRPKVYVKIGV